MGIYEKIRGTIETIFQFGLDGPQIKNDSGGLQVRNNDDTNLAPLQVADPSINQHALTKIYFENNTCLAGKELNYSSSVWTKDGGFAKIDSSTWEDVFYFNFRGTTIHTPSAFIVVASLESATGTAFYRLYDVDNNNEIAATSGKTTIAIEALTDNSLSNLPSSESVFSVQVMASGGAKARIHSYALI